MRKLFNVDDDYSIVEVTDEFVQNYAVISAMANYYFMNGVNMKSIVFLMPEELLEVQLTKDNGISKVIAYQLQLGTLNEINELLETRISNSVYYMYNMISDDMVKLNGVLHDTKGDFVFVPSKEEVQMANDIMVSIGKYLDYECPYIDVNEYDQREYAVDEFLKEFNCLKGYVPENNKIQGEITEEMNSPEYNNLWIINSDGDIIESRTVEFK